MVDFVTEVQEELRKDDYNKWLKRYGPWVVGGILIVIAGAGIWEWRKSQTKETAQITSIAYMDAAESATSGDVDTAIQEFMNLSDTAPSGYAGLSLMRAAELELGKGDTNKAISLLDQAAQTFEHARHTQLAQMKAAYILAGNGQYADVSARLGPLAEKDQPYEYLARELLGFAAKESGNLSGAREQFSYLERIPGVPEAIQLRAKQNLGLMQVATANAQPVTPDTQASETQEPDSKESGSDNTEDSGNTTPENETPSEE